MKFFLNKGIMSLPDGRFICQFYMHDTCIEITMHIGKLMFKTYLAILDESSDIRACANIGVDVKCIYDNLQRTSDVDGALYRSVYPMLSEVIENGRMSEEIINDGGFKTFFQMFYSEDISTKCIALNMKVSKPINAKNHCLGLIKYALDLILEMKLVKTKSLDADEVFLPELKEAFPLILEAKEIFDNHESFIELQLA